MSTELFDLGKLLYLSALNHTTENGKNHHHDWQKAKANKSENWSFPKRYRKTAKEHGNNVEHLPDLFAGTVRYSVEVLLNLTWKGLDRLLFEKGCLLSHQRVEIFSSKTE